MWIITQNGDFVNLAAAIDISVVAATVPDEGAFMVRVDFQERYVKLFQGSKEQCIQVMVEIGSTVINARNLRLPMKVTR